ncbi:phosphoribosyltransferase [Methanococcoides sp. AM1]|uniref:phosphoribosyltransferase n=1 Tax=Methanococcoides sp. AM1 TaxID=1201011 RepID=UPI001FCE606E|nr:phosphoribosyltransferase [Methanococcoides sp. AM1]
MVVVSRYPPADRTSFKCDLMGFGETYNLAKILAKKIRDSGDLPDIIVAIGRGGYVPARLICDFLLFDDLTTIKIEHYKGAADIQEMATLKFPISVDIHDKKILVVDDVTDTGKTLSLAVEYLESLKPAEIKTAVLQHKICSDFVPDYYAKKVVKWRWIIYPWAAYEDLAGFTENIIADRTLTPKQICNEFDACYSITIKGSDLTKILEDLNERGRIECIDDKRKMLWRKANVSK